MREGPWIAAAICLLGLLAPTGCAPAGRPDPAASVAPALEALSPAAEGVAFVVEGSAFVVKGGRAREVADDGAEKVAVVYSADRKSLLVTEVRGASRAVVMVPAGGEKAGSVVLDGVEDSALGSVRLGSASGRLYRAIFGDPENVLIASAASGSSKPATVTLGGGFSGEFDVDTKGSIVYTGIGQNPATVTLKTGTAERPIVPGLATAFTPAFSAGGTRICLTGSERAGGPISVWVVDRDADGPRSLKGTDALRPTFPVFSPEGDRIAFRSADDGAIWIVPLDGGEPRKAIRASDEAPIGW